MASARWARSVWASPAFIAMSALPALAGIDTFRYGNMAWDRTTVGNSTSSLTKYTSGASWANSGNPDGAIFASAPVASSGGSRTYSLSSDVWEALVPGGTLSADIRMVGDGVRTQSGDASSARARWFIASGSSIFISKASLNPNSATSWSNFSTTLSAGDFDAWSSGMDFVTTLLNANTYGVMFLDASVNTGNYNDPSWSAATNFGLISMGSASSSVLIDNVTAIPEGGAAVATASFGLLTLVRRRR
jgi:hypothetical protein